MYGSAPASAGREETVDHEKKRKKEAFPTTLENDPQNET